MPDTPGKTISSPDAIETLATETMTEAEAEFISNAFKALSDRNRLAIYEQIAHLNEAATSDLGTACTIKDFISVLNIGAPTVSHHVKELSKSGLIDVEKKGRNVFCRVNQAAKARLQNFFSKI